MKKIGILIAALAITLWLSAGMASTVSTSAMKAQQRFIKRMHIQHDFDTQSLETLFSQVKLNPKIIAIMERPYESKPWYIYRKHFLSKTRIQKGVQFWHAHAATLKEIEQRYGVPPQIVVAILGVETFYGRRSGSYRVIDALSTLAFDYPKRSKFFEKELSQYLIMCREKDLDPLTLTGSYAGAMGWPQFMPSSYRHYADSYHGDASPDIWSSPHDVMASIGNYLKQNKWRAGEPVASPVTYRAMPGVEIPFNQGRRPKRLVRYWEKRGLSVHPVLHLKANPLRLEMQSHEDYWLGYNNFYAIMSYNPRVPYAMAVYQLSEAIREAY